MKIAIANRRYFESSGPERYLFQITELLEKDGHVAAPFSIRRKWNKETQYSEYFVSPPAGKDVLYYKDYRLNLFQKLRLAANAVYSIEAKKKMGMLIDNLGIDLLYLLTTVNDISPSIIDAAKRRDVPVVMRASDYFMFCPQYAFMRNQGVCRECEQYGYKRALKYRCVQDSTEATVVRVVSMYVHKLLKVYDNVDAFIAPSKTMHAAFLKAGYSEDKVIHVPSFFNSNEVEPSYENDGYILYFGRVDKDKGVLNLIKAYEIGGFEAPLIIAGESRDDEDKRLMEYVRDKNIEKVSFVGFKKKKELIPLIQGAVCTVVPSLWLDNSPLSVLEAMACGKPVIGSDLGGISEQITAESGLLVPPNDLEALASAIASLLSDPQKVIEMGRKGRQRIEQVYSVDNHYGRLMSIFKRLAIK